MGIRNSPAVGEASPDLFFNNDGRHKILFKHPGYAEPHNILLALHAPDQSAGGGIHYGTALVACAIVACNAWNGYLTLEKDGPMLETTEDDVLQLGNYYFHVPDTVEPYPIFPSFRDWSFPHDNLPQHWKAPAEEVMQGARERMVSAGSSTLTAAVLRRDSTCIVTGYGDGLESAHLCPRSETDWYNNNGMQRYNANLTLSSDVSVDDLSNALTLRADIHKVFDDMTFAVVPKERRWVAHFLTTTQDLGRLYHNTKLQLPVSISVEALFSRFAWAIFSSVLLVRTGSGRRKLRMRVDEQGVSGYKEEDVDIGNYQAALRKIIRSRSPRKRPALSSQPMDAVTTAYDISSNCTTAYNSTSYPNNKRRRSSSHSDLKTIKKHRIDEEFRNGSSGLSERMTPSSSVTTCNDNLPISTMKVKESASLPYPPKIEPSHISNVGPSCSNDFSSDIQFQDLRRKHLLAQRPSDPSLYCCDYTVIEADIRAGRPGKKEYDGGYLCPECLGFEFLEEVEPILERDFEHEQNKADQPLFFRQEGQESDVDP